MSFSRMRLYRWGRWRGFSRAQKNPGYASREYPGSVQWVLAADESVTIEFLALFTALLGFQRQVRGRAGQQACQSDRLTRFFAPSVFAGINQLQRLLYLFEQLALTIACAQL